MTAPPILKFDVNPTPADQIISVAEYLRLPGSEEFFYVVCLGYLTLDYYPVTIINTEAISIWKSYRLKNPLPPPREEERGEKDTFVLSNGISVVIRDILAILDGYVGEKGDSVITIFMRNGEVHKVPANEHNWTIVGKFKSLKFNG